LWVTKCLFKFPFNENPLLHNSQVNCLWPVCTNMCLFKSELFAKPFSQTPHRKGLSPVCINWWVFKLELCVKQLPQISQQNGLSPVCITWCCLKCEFCAKLLLQIPHVKGLSSLCVFKCCFNWDLHSKLLLQILHGKSCCASWCASKSHNLGKDFLHIVQEWRLSAWRSLTTGCTKIVLNAELCVNAPTSITWSLLKTKYAILTRRKRKHSFCTSTDNES